MQDGPFVPHSNDPRMGCVRLLLAMLLWQQMEPPFLLTVLVDPPNIYSFS